MAYITQTDLLQRMTLLELTQLTDDANTGAPDPNVVSGILDEASAKVEGYTRNKYAMPLQQSSEIAAIARDIAVYLLFSRRAQPVRDAVRQRYMDAIQLLTDISSGRASLDQPASSTPQSVIDGPTVIPHEPIFGECHLEGFV